MTSAKEMLSDKLANGLYPVRGNEITMPSFVILELMKDFADQFNPVTFRNTKKSNLLSLLDEVCGFFQLPQSEVVSKSRKRELADARAIYCRHAKMIYPNYTWRNIGAVINRDHATVIAAYKRAHALKDIDIKYRQCYARKTKIAYSIMASAGGTGIQSISHTSKGPVVSYGKMEKGSERLPETQPAVQNV